MTPPVELCGVSLARDGRRVVEGASLALAPGERVAILGPNGAGKTTLLRSVVGLERPVAGEIRLFGRPCVREADFRAARPRIGFLFQDSDDQLFCPSVLEDVAFGPLNTGATEAEARTAAEAALEGVGIAHLAGRFTHRLSGGEKRLVCLAGLLAMRPEVLLLDEPTNGVDRDHLARLHDALAVFKGAIALVSHDEAFLARIATRVLVLGGGRLAVRPPPG